MAIDRSLDDNEDFFQVNTQSFNNNDNENDDKDIFKLKLLFLKKQKTSI